MERSRIRVRAPNFPVGLDWLNVEQPLALPGLRGKLVVLDFWTSCCINCQHALEELRAVEARFPHEVVVIGVHSPKFHGEADTHAVRQAVIRHDIRHPVVNDAEYHVWRAYAIRAWPTLVLIDPAGTVIAQHSGEFRAESLGRLLQELVEEFDRDDLIDRRPLQLQFERDTLLESALCYPGKVLADPAVDRLYVADTGHHRIVEYRLSDLRPLRAWGGDAGDADGEWGDASFRSPQGLARRGDRLIVADTGNHRVREIDLVTGTTVTLAGTGEQARGPITPGNPATPLNSPWDVALAGGDLFVAMAGSHQVWRLGLDTRDLSLFAGDGGEGLRDGPRRQARLAQPSGLAVASERLWVADSESSSVRSVPIEAEGDLRTHIGQGLFDFGDRDGDAATGRLQHPLGVAVSGTRLYVADTYNHKVRMLDMAAGELATLSGCGEAGWDDGPAEHACFWEPGGISLAGDCLYLADTNNHQIRRVRLDNGAATTLDLADPPC